MTRAWCALVLVMLVACGGGPRQPESDACGILACQQFSDVMRKAKDGVLSNTEIRAELKAIYEQSSCAQVPAVRESARGMLAAVTAGSSDELARFAGEMAKGCAAVRR